MSKIKSIAIGSLDGAQRVEATILQAATQVAAWIKCTDFDGLALIKKMKFEPIGFHPIDHRPLNLIEQINQTFTCLVSIRAVEQLFRLHPEANGFLLNMAEQQGSDIESADGRIAAEVFAAVKPSNNQKLKKDIQKEVKPVAPLTAEIKVDKSTAKANEPLKYTLIIKNNTDKAMDGLKMKFVNPNGLGTEMSQEGGSQPSFDQATNTWT